VHVQLEHLASVSRAIEPCLDAREAIARVRVDIDRAVHVAIVPAIERAVGLVRVVVARGEGEEYRRDVPLAAEGVSATVTIEVNLAHNQKASPLSLAPDIWWSDGSRWTIGLTHSMASVDRFQPGGSLCVRTDALYCDSTYRGGHLDARYALALAGDTTISPRARFLLRDIEPAKPAITAGALVEHTRGRFHFRADPYLQLGLANRDQGNRAALFLPLQVALAATSRITATLDTGWNAELAVLGDGWHVPVAPGAQLRIDEHLAVGTTVGFASLLGPQNTPKQRVLFIGLSWRE
jgi:hypothetical protein